MTPRSAFASIVLAAPALAVVSMLGGCNGDLSTSPSVAHLAAPSRSAFDPVADAMQLHCGTLDCHGEIGRNMRLYGQYGLRLNPKDDPLNEPTSDAEYTATYWSIVGLEPEAMSLVVQHQASPATLTMVRKPTGIEDHKGGILIQSGDPLDHCMLGWLLGSPDLNACLTVAQMPRPEPDAGAGR
jgi:hypothetical protein